MVLLFLFHPLMLSLKLQFADEVVGNVVAAVICGFDVVVKAVAIRTAMVNVAGIVIYVAVVNFAYVVASVTVVVVASVAVVVVVASL